MDTASKENMQNTIKTLEDKILHIEKLLEKGSDCLIFQFGSHSIKYNRANETAPKKLLNLIAYKRKAPVVQQNETEFNDFDQFDYHITQVESALKQKGAIKNDAKLYKGKPRGKVEVDLKNISCFMNQIEKQQQQQYCPFIDKIISKEMILEDEAFLYENNPDYIVRQPIRYGYFSSPSSIDDIYNLTTYIITVKLGIPLKDINEMSSIVIIPDVFQRQQIKEIVDLFLRVIGFKQIYLHVESVLAFFGANVAQACIVDIGHDKINVCCIDEGVIVPGSFVRKNFGMKDLNIAFMRAITKRHAVQHKKGFKLDPNILCDLHQMSKMIERASQTSGKEDKSNYVYELHTVREGHEERFQVQHTDSLQMVSQLLFESDALNAIEKSKEERYDFTSNLFEMYYDPEDNLEEFSGGVQLSWCWGSKDREQQFFNQEEIYNQLHPTIMQPLDTLVLNSLAGVFDQEQRAKYASNIILVGGGAHLVDLAEELEQRITKRAAEFDLQDIEKLEVKVIVREDIRPQCLSWTGASVLPKTDSIGEMWITRLRWIGEIEQQHDDVDYVLDQYDGDVNALEKKVMQLVKKEKEKEKSAEWGLKHLKEKIPFVW